VIKRIALSGGGDYALDLRIPFNYEQRIEVPILAGDATEEHNIHLVYDPLDQTLGELPAGIEVTLGQPLPVLTAAEKAQLNFSLTADNTAEPTDHSLIRKLLLINQLLSH